MDKKSKRRAEMEALEACIPTFIVLSDNAQVWTGLKGGSAVFSDNWDEAKPLKRHEQFLTLQRVSPVKIEKYFL